MTMMMLDAAPTAVASTTGLAAGAIFLLTFCAVAFVVYRLLKRTVKMAFRLAIVGVILFIAVAGSIAFWALGTSSNREPARPTRSR